MINQNTRITSMLSDKVFKSVLQDKQQEDYLIDMINHITKIPIEDIKDNMMFQNTEFAKDSINEKGKVADLIMTIGNNVINLEMNKKLYLGLVDKNDRYIYKLREGYTDNNKKEFSLHRIIQINFDNYELFDDSVVLKFEMMNKEKGIVRSDYVETSSIEIYHVNLKKVRQMYYNKEKLSRFEKGLLIMTLDDERELKEVAKGDEKLEKVANKIISLSKEEELRGIYIKEEQDEWIRERYKEEGLRDGMKQGLEEGRKKGIEEGIKENQRQIINNMIINNFDKETIAKITKLSIKEIEEFMK